MKQTMAWSHFSKSDPLRQAAEWIDQTVTAIRNRGHTREHAMEQASLALGVGRRRVRALLYGEAFSIAPDELDRLRDGFLAHLDDEAEHLAQRAAEARARRRQMELEL